MCFCSGEFMNQIGQYINYIFTLILQGCYAYLGYKINLSYEYSDITEFYIGIFVTTVLMNILDWLFYLIAYNIVKYVSHIDYLDSFEKKALHWIIRVLLYVIVFIISITPLCNYLITPIVKDVTEIVLNWINNNTTNYSEKAVEVLVK